jgi:transcriptional regulator of acetoin/glycerol metabolism
MMALTVDALAVLRAYLWPGNVRELHNVLERALCFARGPKLTAQDVRSAISGLRPSRSGDAAPSKTALAHAALNANGGSHTRAARSLGIGRTTLWRWLSSEPTSLIGGK